MYVSGKNQNEVVHATACIHAEIERERERDQEKRNNENDHKNERIKCILGSTSLKALDMHSMHQLVHRVLFYFTATHNISVLFH